MTAIKRTVTYRKQDGTNFVDTTIVSNSTPNPLPTTGAEVKGLQDTDRFAPMSILYVVDTAKVYMANEDGVFILQ